MTVDREAADALDAPATRRAPRPSAWVVAELEVDGEIDDHAAMCLQHAIGGAPAAGTAMILVDLRELAAIEADGLELFVRHHADCLAGGVELGLLICGDVRQHAIARAFDAAGLGDQLQFAYEPGTSPAVAPHPPRAGQAQRVHEAARAKRIRRLADAGRPRLDGPVDPAGSTSVPSRRRAATARRTASGSSRP